MPITLRKRDTNKITAVGSLSILFLGAALAAPPKDTDLEKRLEAAIHRELVLGDLAGAITEYRAILASGSKLRPVEARALFHIGLCMEKSGRAGDARDIYERVTKEYPGQDSSAQARAKLDNWGSTIIGPMNLKFDQGVPGKLPAAWFVPALPNEADQQAQLRRRGCMTGDSCAIVMVPDNALTQVGTLMQSFSAAAWRGKLVRLRAWLRLEPVSASDQGQMWIGVDRANNVTANPVRSEEWTQSEIRIRVPNDASFIKFGVSSIGKGKVWVDNVTFETLPQ
ncbi:MAG: tetratricopeptide repeat protein [Acidobacteria bacterium]|nr:tetratricopeptide repeat protein [Acidobacteriota bacterium]